MSGNITAHVVSGWASEWIDDHTPIKSRCCFNHYIGLPEKHNRIHPLYDYEQLIFDTLFSTKDDEQSQRIKNKHAMILKAGGLGVTEFFLRIIGWLCTRDDFYKSAQMAVITGPNIDLAIGLIIRLKRLFPNFEFETKETLAIINGCRVQSFPSHNLHALRSLTRLAFCLLDEADFFEENEGIEARAVTERYIPKSDPYLCVVSTPNVPGRLMNTLLDEPDALSVYHKILLPYTIGLGKIYTPEEIERARASPTFEREYNLQFGHGVGNIFPLQDLAPAIVDFDLTLRDGFKVLAVDPAFGVSKFAIVGAEALNGTVYIKEAIQYDRPSPVQMTQKLIDKAPLYSKNVCVDSAHPGLILDLCAAGINADPIKFNVVLSEMTMRAVEAVKAGRVKIHKAQNELISQLKSVKYNEKGHPDKRELSADLVDAFLMAIYYCDMGDVGYIKMPFDE